MVAVAWRRWRGWERREAGASRYPPGGCPAGCPSPGRGPLAPTPSPPSLPSPPPRAGAAALEGRSRLSPNQHGLRDLKALNLPFGGRLEHGSPPNSHQKRRTSLIAFTGPCYPLFRDSSRRTRSPSRRFPQTPDAEVGRPGGAGCALPARTAPAAAICPRSASTRCRHHVWARPRGSARRAGARGVPWGRWPPSTGGKSTAAGTSS